MVTWLPLKETCPLPTAMTISAPVPGRRMMLPLPAFTASEKVRTILAPIATSVALSAGVEDDSVGATALSASPRTTGSWSDSRAVLFASK